MWLERFDAPAGGGGALRAVGGGGARQQRRAASACKAAAAIAADSSFGSKHRRARGRLDGAGPWDRAALLRPNSVGSRRCRPSRRQPLSELPGTGPRMKPIRSSPCLPIRASMMNRTSSCLASALSDLVCFLFHFYRNCAPCRGSVNAESGQTCIPVIARSVYFVHLVISILYISRKLFFAFVPSFAFSIGVSAWPRKWSQEIVSSSTSRAAFPIFAITTMSEDVEGMTEECLN